MKRFVYSVTLLAALAGCAGRPDAVPLGPEPVERGEVRAAVARTQEELARSGYGRTRGAAIEAIAYAASVRDANPEAFAFAERAVPRLEEFGEPALAAARVERSVAAQGLESMLARVQRLVNPIAFSPNSFALSSESRQRLQLNAEYIVRSRGVGGVVAVAGFAEPTERGAAQLAHARADAVISGLQEQVGSMVRGGGVGTDRGFGGSNRRALVMYFAQDNVTRILSGPRVRGPIGNVRSTVESWARARRWTSSVNVEPFELKFPEVPELSTERRRTRWASYRVIFVPDARQPGCLETHIFFTFYSRSSRERRTYSTTADRTLAPAQAPTAQALLKTLERLEGCNG